MAINGNADGAIPSGNDDGTAPPSTPRPEPGASSNPSNRTDVDPYPADLWPEHRDYLWKRGVTPAAARARGYRSVRSGRRNVDESYAAAYSGLPRLAGLLMPLHPLLGGDQRYQLRPDDPRLTVEGKPIKFECQAHMGNVLATSPLTADLLRQESQTIVIAEGITRVDALAEYGIPAVAIPGCYAWRDKGGALPDFEELRLSGNVFILAFDGDAASNPSVNNALARLARYLRAKGATVGLLEVPDDDEGDQRGLDDWLFEERFPDPATVMRELQLHTVDSIDFDPLRGAAEPEPEGPLLPEGWQWPLFVLDAFSGETGAVAYRARQRRRRPRTLSALLASGQLPLPIPPDDSPASAAYWELLQSGAVEYPDTSWQWPIPAASYEPIIA